MNKEKIPQLCNSCIKQDNIACVHAQILCDGQECEYYEQLCD